MEAFNFTAASEDCNLYTYDMRKLGTAACVHKVKDAGGGCGTWVWSGVGCGRCLSSCCHVAVWLLHVRMCLGPPAHAVLCLCLLPCHADVPCCAVLCDPHSSPPGQDFVSAVMDVDYSPTGREFVAGSYDRSVRIFGFNAGHSREVRAVLCCAVLGCAQAPTETAMTTHSIVSHGVLAAGHAAVTAVKVWRGIKHWRPCRCCCCGCPHTPPPHQVYHTKRMQRVFCVRFSGDASYVFSGSDDMNVRVWKADASEQLGVTLSREKHKQAYNKALVNRCVRVCVVLLYLVSVPLLPVFQWLVLLLCCSCLLVEVGTGGGELDG